MNRPIIALMLLVTLGFVSPVLAEDPAARIESMEKIADLALIPPKLNTSPLPDYDSPGAHSLALGREGIDAEIIASLATDPVQHMNELSEYNDKFSKLNTVNTAINSLGSMQTIIDDMVRNAVSFF